MKTENKILIGSGVVILIAIVAYILIKKNNTATQQQAALPPIQQQTLQQPATLPPALLQPQNTPYFTGGVPPTPGYNGSNLTTGIISGLGGLFSGLGQSGIFNRNTISGQVNSQPLTTGNNSTDYGLYNTQPLLYNLGAVDTTPTTNPAIDSQASTGQTIDPWSNGY